MPTARLSLWDRAPLARLIAGDSTDPVLVMRGVFPAGGTGQAAWFVVGPGGAPESARLIVVADDTASGSGRPLTWRSESSPLDSAVVAATTLPRLAPRPGAPAIERGDVSGVPLGGLFRRLALAWALQAGGLVATEESSVGWLLAPGGSPPACGPLGLVVGYPPVDRGGTAAVGG